jgi:hypothetical protein
MLHRKEPMPKIRNRKGIARQQSQFPHPCVGERFINSHDRSAYSSAGKYVLGIYKSLTDT